MCRYMYLFVGLRLLFRTEKLDHALNGCMLLNSDCFKIHYLLFLSLFSVLIPPVQIQKFLCVVHKAVGCHPCLSLCLSLQVKYFHFDISWAINHLWTAIVAHYSVDLISQISFFHVIQCLLNMSLPLNCNNTYILIWSSNYLFKDK